MTTFPERGQQSPNYWDTQLKAYVDEGVGAQAAVASAISDPESEIGTALSATIASAVAAEPTVVAAAAAAVADELPPVRAAATLHLNLRHAAQRGKGGVVGTNGRAAVCFRIDHGVQQWLDTFWPQFRDRGIPASIGVVTNAIGDAGYPYEGTAYTWEQLRKASHEGFEIWSHSAGHAVPPSATRAAYHAEAIAPKAVIEANGIRCIGYQQPGAGGSPNAIPDWSANWVPGKSWDSELGQLLMATYGLIEINGADGGALRALPSPANDLGWYTLDSNTLAGMKARVDQAIAMGCAVKFMVHPAFIAGDAYPFKSADLTALLDYVKEKVDAGLLLALTASGLQHADKAAQRFDLLYDNDFATAATSGAPWTASTAAVGHVTFGADGRTYAQLGTGSGTGYLYQANQQVVNFAAAGQTYMAEVEARAVGGVTQLRIEALDETNPTELTRTATFDLAAGGAWATYRMPITIPTVSTRVVQRVRRMTGLGAAGALQVRGARLRPV